MTKGGEATDISRAASELAKNVSDKLKTAGVDTHVMAEAAREQSTELQKLVLAELQRRPFQALALAGFVGFWFGLRH